MNEPPPPLDAALQRLRWPLGLTRAGMVAERALRAFWPGFTALGLLVAALGFGALDLAPAAGRLWLVLAAGLIVLGLLARGALRFRWPDRAEAVARLDATLPGRPLTALGDGIALGGNDAAARGLWQAHLVRMAARLAGVRPVPPDPQLAARDPFALRLVALTALTMALLFGAPTRVVEALRTGTGPAAAAAAGPTWEGWAEPPRYTGRPGLYLNTLGSDALTLPAGTRLSFRLYGAPGVLDVQESVSAGAAPLPAPPPEGEVQSLDLEAVRSGTVAITGPGGRSFELTILPDATPAVEVLGGAERRADGRLSQPFRARDDYAVTAGRATITLDLGAVDRRFGLGPPPEAREALVFDLPLPITGSRADFTEVLAEDAARHPWANLPVRLNLSVEDGRGQIGVSAPVTMELPGRRFFDPLAAALIEMRRDLLWSRENAPRVAELLKAVSHRPEGFVRAERVYLMLRVAIRRLDAALATGPLDPALRDELAEALWEMAELLEDGGLSDALAAMRQAQERLSEAIRNGASPDEIAKLMEDLKAATDNYIRQLAERGEQADPAERFTENQQGQQITGDQIQQMMDEIERLMQEGRMAEAQELLDQLARMMENLRVTQGQDGEGMQGPGGQAMRDLADTLRRQQGLSDEAFRQLQEGTGQGQGQPGEPAPGQGQNGQGPSGQGQSGQGQSGQGQGDQGNLAQRQRDLREDLGRQQGLMPGTGSEAGDQARQRLDEAGRAMERAEEALRQGDNATALDQQADAIEALREGMRSLGEALAEQQGGAAGQGAARPGQGEGQAGREMPRDPLGRTAGEGGRIGTDETLLQGEDVYRRARDLLDEIRRRSGERLRPEDELDYLRRLLERF